VRIDWGDVPTWVGSITTSGTLLLGLVILIREQTRQRGELIGQVSYWARIDPDGTMHAYLDNAGSLPIKVVMLGRAQYPTESIKWRHTGVVEPFALREPHMYFVPPGNGFRVTFSRVAIENTIRGAILYDPLNLTVMDNRAYAWCSTIQGWKRVKPSAQTRRALAGGTVPVVDPE